MKVGQKKKKRKILLLELIIKRKFESLNFVFLKFSQVIQKF
jgi:hypothetical protein